MPLEISMLSERSHSAMPAITEPVSISLYLFRDLKYFGIESIDIQILLYGNDFVLAVHV